MTQVELTSLRWHHSKLFKCYWNNFDLIIKNLNEHKMKWRPCTGFRYGDNKTPALFSIILLFVFYHGEQKYQNHNSQNSSKCCSWGPQLVPQTFIKVVNACVLSHFSCVWLVATLWTVAHQAPLSMGFSRNTGVGCHALLQGIFLTQGLNLMNQCNCMLS